MKTINRADSEYCFGCSPDNPIGLKLKFQENGDTYSTTFTAGKEHEGYHGVVHGGIVSALLDEAMAGYLYAKGKYVVTARLEIRYKKPTPVGEPLTVTARMGVRRRNMVEMHGTVTLPDGGVTAEGKAVLAILEE